MAVLEALTDLGVPDIPQLLRLVEDDEISPYPVVVCRRLPGVPVADVVEDLDADDLEALFEALGRATVRWHALRVDGLELPVGDSLEPVTRVSDELAASPAERRASRWAADRASRVEPVVVHGDLHEGQLLVDPNRPRALTGVLDWQTARVDHPFADFDFGEWGTAMWRAHRRVFRVLRRRAWDGYASERNLAEELWPVFEWFHAASHLARRTGVAGFPVEHAPEITGTVDEARHQLRAALAALQDVAGT